MLQLVREALEKVGESPWPELPNDVRQFCVIVTLARKRGRESQRSACGG